MTTRRFTPLLCILLLSLCSTAAGETPFKKGDVFVAVPGGRVLHFDKQGDLRQTLDTKSGAYETGLCLDSAGTLYSTNFTTNSMSTFSRKGVLDEAQWGGPFNHAPESCVTDKKGYVYTGEADGERRIRKFSPEGKLLETFQVAGDNRGADWIELAADQCTVYYTSEGSRIKRYDVCRKRQLDDFTTGLAGPCYALRLLRSGGLTAACERQVYRLNREGEVVKSYPIAGESLFSMNIDPSGKFFWSAGHSSGNVYKVNIASGAGAEQPIFTIPGVASIGGLAIYGERTVAARPAGIDEPEEESALGTLPTPPGSVEFGTPSTIDFGRLAGGSGLSRDLGLDTVRIEGTPMARLTTDLEVAGVALEVETPAGWEILSDAPVDLALAAGTRPRLRLRIGRCLGEARAAGYSVFVEAPGVGGGTATLKVPLRLAVEKTPWLVCWRPLWVSLLALVAVAVAIHGIVSPSRFSRRLGVVLSPEEDLEEGFFHPIRAERRSGSGFYRDARIYVSSGFCLTSKAQGSLVRLRAEGTRVQILPLPGHLIQRRSADESWEPLPADESAMRFGVTYRDEGGTLFFELRNS